MEPSWKGVIMQLGVTLDEQGFLPDAFAKHAPSADKVDGTPTRSFPFGITGIPTDATALALALIDYDSIPVCGFAWIHWTAALRLPTDCDGRLAVPEDASSLQAFGMVQGRNSSAAARSATGNPQVACRYNGPQPPDKAHVYTLYAYALDDMPALAEGFWANELVWATKGHVLATARADLPARV